MTVPLCELVPSLDVPLRASDKAGVEKHMVCGLKEERRLNRCGMEKRADGNMQREKKGALTRNGPHRPTATAGSPFR